MAQVGESSVAKTFDRRMRTFLPLRIELDILTKPTACTTTNVLCTMGKRRRTSDDATLISAEPVRAAEDSGAPQAKKLQQRRSLFLRSLASNTTTEALINHFSQSYPIKHATAVINSTTKACKGYGFVTFADADDAQRALEEFNGSTLLGRTIKAEIAEPRSREIEDPLPTELSGPGTRKLAAERATAKRENERKEQYKAPKLIVRNLPWSVKKPEELERLFRSYGKVKHAIIPAKKPGLMAGFGFVVLKGRKNAEKAIAGINGKEVDGRTLAVDWAVEKEVWEKQQNPHGPTSASEDNIDHDSSALDEDDVLLANDGENNEESDEAGDSEERNDGLSDEEVEDERPPPDYSSTIFVRNLPYTSTDETLRTHFSHFGPIRYARVVVDSMTERPRGTAFVCFFEAADAQSCLRSAPNPLRPPGAHTSVLQSETDDPTGHYTMEGRVLSLSRAVDRTEASRLASGAKVSREEKDKRRLYLLSEGTISTTSPLYDKLSQSEVAIREASAKQRKALIQSNPSLHLSLTRLSIRNIPRSVTSKDLKKLARDAVVGFASDVKAGKRQRLSKEELLRGGDEMIAAEKQRKKSGKGIVKQAKVVFEGREGGKVNEETGAGRSRGYGFIEFYNHRSALMGLRWLNGHIVDYQISEKSAGKNGKEEVKERKKRLIVEFAIENAQVVKRRRENEDRARGVGKGTSTLNVKTKSDDVPDLFDVVGRRQGEDAPKATATVGKIAKMVLKGKIKPGEEDKQAQRQRIINKKRAMRRSRKRVGGGKS